MKIKYGLRPEEVDSIKEIPDVPRHCVEEDFGGEPVAMREKVVAAAHAVADRVTGAEAKAADALLARWIKETAGIAALSALNRETAAYLAKR